MESKIKSGVKTNEFKFVAVAQIAPLLSLLFGSAPPLAMYLALIVISCGYIVLRGIMKLPLTSDGSSWSTSEMWIAAGSFVQLLAAHTNGVVSTTWLTAGTVAVTISFFVSRVLAKNDWLGYMQKMFSGNPRDSLKEIATYAAKEAVENLRMKLNKK